MTAPHAGAIGAAGNVRRSNGEVSKVFHVKHFRKERREPISRMLWERVPPTKFSLARLPCTTRKAFSISVAGTCRLNDCLRLQGGVMTDATDCGSKLRRALMRLPTQ